MKLSKLLIAVCTAMGLGNAANASEDFTTYIYNGQTTTTATWPSYAAVYYDASSVTGVYGQYCGATILDEDHVLTAAHCISDGNGGLNTEYLVFTSVLPQLSNKNEFLSGTVENIRVKNIYVHPEYVDSSSQAEVPWPNDIAILELEDTMNVDTSAYARRADTSQVASYRLDNNSFVAVGMGLTEDEDYATQLLWTSLQYESTEICDLGAGDSQLCMKGEYSATTGVRNSTCSGDSGGPLYWYDPSAFEYVQVGITSYGWNNCYEPSSEDVSVFTEVADYDAWITKVVNDELTADLVITDELREQYGATVTDPIPGGGSTTEEDDESDYQTTSGDSSGGSTSFGMLGLLAVAGYFRRKYNK